MAIVESSLFTPAKTEYNKPEKMEKVIEGEVVKRKRPLGRQLSDIFLAEDWDTVKQYIVWDVIIPGIKYTFVNALEMMILGETRGGGNGKYRDYTSYSRNNNKTNRRDFTDNNRSKPDYRDYTFQTRRDAEEVLAALRDRIREYGSSSVADFYDAVGQSTEYTENRYGWTNLDKASVRPCRDGYYIDLPKAIVID